MRFEHLGFAPDFVDYQQAWDHQRAVLTQVADGTLEPTVLLLEHSPVYTAGRTTEPQMRPKDGTPVVDTDRGGKITWHGPGQLVGYPILRLPAPINVVAHVRRLEEVMMRITAHFGVETTRVEGRSGVWVLADDRGPDRKLGAIGVRVSQQCTMHGFALNCDADLSWGENIIPCGIEDADVSSISIESGRHVTVQDALPVAEQALNDVLGPVAVEGIRRWRELQAEQARKDADRASAPATGGSK